MVQLISNELTKQDQLVDFVLSNNKINNDNDNNARQCRWKIINLPDTGILSNVDAFYKREGEVGYSTNGYLVIKDLIDRKAQMDKIMMFTDCQLWNSHSDLQITDLWRKYKKICPVAKLYLFDLSGYGNTPLGITRDDVFLIAGWSDKIFDILSAIDKGNDALQEIKKIVV